MEINQDKAKQWMMESALRYLGTPYRWAGDDPVKGFDCSGFILELLKTAGFVREKEDLTADQLMKLFERKRVESPRAGALLFYLNTSGSATHVVFCIDDEYQIGASGGGSTTKTEQDAVDQNAYIKIRPIPKPLIVGKHVVEYLF